jgi:hypothetical protein
LRDGLCPACWYASTDRPKPVRDRYAKLARLDDLGIEPYAYGFDRGRTKVRRSASPAALSPIGIWEAAPSGTSATGAGDFRSTSSAIFWRKRIPTFWISWISGTGWA